MSAFYNFSSFNKAAEFIEDWIRVKKNNPLLFKDDFLAILQRGLLVRKMLSQLKTKEDKVTDENSEQNDNIFSKELYPCEDDYIFYFTLNLIEACSARPKMPIVIIKNTLW